MIRPNRYRRGTYALARPSVIPSLVRIAVVLGVVGLILWWLAKLVLGFFDTSRSMERAKVDLRVDGGAVSMAIDGGLMQRTQGASKLYAGDKVSTGANGKATLVFADGTEARLDGQTEVSIDRSERSEVAVAVAIGLSQGSLWVTSPESGSGEVTRQVVTPSFTLAIPSDAKVLVREASVLVFAADGDGVRVTTSDDDTGVLVGEGQKLALDDSGGLSSSRSALSPQDWIDPFARAGMSASSGGAADPLADLPTLAITEPKEGASVQGSLLTVRGTYGLGVVSVRVNGSPASLQETAQTFSQELAMERDGDFTVTAEALDADNQVIETVRRTVKRGTAVAAAPTIEQPAKGGQTYRTNASEILISGTAGPSIAGIMVNEYRLQLFTPGKGSWTYLAKLELNNLKPGTNVFDVYGLDAAGNKSAPVRLTIIQGQGDGGVVAGGTASAGSATSAAPQVDESTLPQNAPTAPGTLTITGPAAGTSYTATGSEILIEGTTSPQTASVWVNGYKLQLYVAGKRAWNYIARKDYANLKSGTNLYKVVARDKDNQILDKVEYTVTAP